MDHDKLVHILRQMVSSSKVVVPGCAGQGKEEEPNRGTSHSPRRFRAPSHRPGHVALQVLRCPDRVGGPELRRGSRTIDLPAEPLARPAAPPAGEPSRRRAPTGRSAPGFAVYPGDASLRACRPDTSF